MRPVLLGVVVLFGTLAALPRAARAADPPPGGQNQLTIDVGAASIGVTHAWRLTTPLVLFGGGGGMGLSPLLGKVVVAGGHSASEGWLEFVHAQLFLRFELASWLRVDSGARAGLFLHYYLNEVGGDTSRGGPFAALFVAPALVWRWLWIGPRISGGVLAGAQRPDRRRPDDRIRHAALRVHLVAPARHVHKLAHNTARS